MLKTLNKNDKKILLGLFGLLLLLLVVWLGRVLFSYISEQVKKEKRRRKKEVEEKEDENEEGTIS